MKSKFVLAQVSSSGDVAANLEKAKKMMARAYEEHHPDVMVFPEVFMAHFPVGTPKETILAACEPLDGPFVTGLREEAKKYGMWVICGMSEKVEDPSDPRKYNTTVVINSEGELVGSYRKTHLYDAFGYKESDANKPGDKFFEPIDTPFGKIGLFVCYEVRFPEVARYQRSKGADIGLSLEYKGINWYISPLFWASLFYYAVIKVLEPKKANVLIAVIVYFSYLVNISSCNGGFGRETVYGIVNLGLTRALAGIGLGYLIGVGIETFQTIGFNYKNKHTKRGKIAVLTMVELIICIFFVYYFLLGGQYQNKFIVVILFSVLLISFLLRGGMVSRELNRPVFSLLGKYAYSIYVMQQISFWILQKTLWRTNIVGRVGLCICVSLLFSILVGVITYYMIECPFSKLYLNFYIRKD